MLRSLLLLALLLPAICYSRTVATPFTEGEPVEISAGERLGLFQQCSRQAPQPEEILGNPTAAEVRELEPLLERYLAVVYEAGKAAPPTATYARQYVAYRVGTRRKIYGNFFPRALANEARRKEIAVAVCDGGPAFWGVVYDPLSKQFEQLELNGPR